MNNTWIIHLCYGFIITTQNITKQIICLYFDVLNLQFLLWKYSVYFWYISLTITGSISTDGAKNNCAGALTRLFTLTQASLFSLPWENQLLKNTGEKQTATPCLHFKDIQMHEQIFVCWSLIERCFHQEHPKVKHMFSSGVFWQFM